MRKLWVVLLAIFFLLYGLFAVTNIRVEWGATLMGFLALGIAALLVFDR